MNMQTIVDEVQKLWNGDKKFFEDKFTSWVKDINNNIGDIEAARKDFHQWEPLRVYTSTTRLKSSPSTFSLRFLGQEVAEIKVNNKAKQVKIVLSKDHINWSKRDFKIPASKIFRSAVDWDSKEAKEFRDFFKTLPPHTTTHSLEHKIETAIIRAMNKGPKLAGMNNIQPVLIGGCPLQFPVPVKASSGLPEKSTRGANIDILARRSDGRRRLSVWELKRPGLTPSALKKAIQQCITYSSTLTLMLRSRSGADWYRLFNKPNSVIPKILEVEAVIAIDKKDSINFQKALSTISFPKILSIAGGRIIPYVAYYDYDPAKGTIGKVSLNKI